MKQATLRVIFLTVFIDLLGFGLIVPILPIYIKELGASNIQVGIIAASYSLMNFLFTPFFGSYSDRFGRRPILLITIAINVIAYILFGFAQTLPLLILSRLLSGIGSSNISVAQAYISDISTPENRAKSMGMIGAAFGLGFVFGPLFGALLSEKLGVGGIGFTAAGLCAVNLIWAYFSLPESLKTKNKVAPIQFVPIQDYQMALRRPIIRELFLLNLVYITAFSMMHINSPLLWKEHYGLEKKQILYVFAFIGVVTAFVQGGLVGLMVKKFGEQRLLLYGCFFMMIGLFLMPIVPKYLFAEGIIVSMTCIALGAGCLQPSMASITSQQILPHEQGRMLGLSQSFGSIARVIGPFMGGFLYDFAYWLPFIGGSAMMIGGVYLVRQVLIQIQKK